MFIVRAFAALAFVLLPLSATAQITLTADDLRLPLDMAWEQEVATIPARLADSGFDVGAAGADQFFDLTGSLADHWPTHILSFVVSLEQTPGAADFPAADYAVFNIINAPNASGGTDETETYTYFERQPQGDVPIGAEGPAGQVPAPVIDTGIPWPLEFGKSWEVEDWSLEQFLAPGVTSSGLYNYQYAVDAWGEIRLPAGTFDCLRVHQTGVGVVSFAGDAQLAALGEVTAEIDAYGWYAKGVGVIATVVETRQTFASGDIAPITTVQIARLIALSNPASAIETQSWGALKRRFAE